MITGLSVAAVQLMNAEVLGPRSRSVLLDEPALAAVLADMTKEVAGYELYPSPYLKAVVLARGIAACCPFASSNYKTAWLAATVFLGLNGIDLRRMDPFEPNALIFDLAYGELSVADAVHWLTERTLER